jgi:shikimate dehydrogenase
MKKMFALLGDPVDHSLSPSIHNAAFRALGIDAQYIKIQVKPDKLEDAIKGFKALGIAGANITIPHKINVMEFLDEIDPLAKDIGAVNTIVNKNGRLIGSNTDGHGALESLRQTTSLMDKRITLLGAGGAARAIAFTLAKEEKIQNITIMNIDQKMAVQLAEKISEKSGIKTIGVLLNEENLESHLAVTDILINCTPIGMHPKTDESLVPPALLSKDLTVFDIVYNPIETNLIKDAKAAGCTTISGVNMLVLQGAKSFEIFTGKKPDVGLMLAVVHNKIAPSKKQNIALLGFMGTGKTSTGKIIAKKLQMNFIDIDQEIEKMAGIKIPSIFEKFGETRFRELEIEAIKLHSQKDGVVLSCGGGTVLNFLNMLRLKETSQMFLLIASPKEILKRLRNEKNRPLLALEEEEKERRIIEILEERKSFYDATGAIKIETDGLKKQPERQTANASIKKSKS